MIDLDYSSLQQFLAKQLPSIALQEQTNQLYAQLTIDGKEYPFFVRIFEGNILLQIIAFIPCTWTSYHTPEVAQLLHLLNREVELPGFGLDDNIRLPFFRYMLFAKDGKVDPDILEATIEAIKIACATFTPVISQVAEGKLSYIEVVRIAKEKGLLGSASASKNTKDAAEGTPAHGE
jgi:hypothetical protein